MVGVSALPRPRRGRAGRPARPARARRGSRDLDGRGVPVWPGRARAPARAAALAGGRRPDRRAVTGRDVVRRAPPGRGRRCADSQALRLRPGSSVRPVGPRLPGPGRDPRPAQVERSGAGLAGPDRGAWLSWYRTTESAAGAAELPYKLYISPHVDELTEVLPAAVAALTATEASRFKIGTDAAGLLRPDKFVVYLRDAAPAADGRRGTGPGPGRSPAARRAVLRRTSRRRPAVVGWRPAAGRRAGRRRTRELAAVRLPSAPSTCDRYIPGSLHKGELGVADLARPETASMPFFGSMR